MYSYRADIMKKKHHVHLRKHVTSLLHIFISPSMPHLAPFLSLSIYLSLPLSLSLSFCLSFSLSQTSLLCSTSNWGTMSCWREIQSLWAASLLAAPTHTSNGGKVSFLLSHQRKRGAQCGRLNFIYSLGGLFSFLHRDYSLCRMNIDLSASSAQTVSVFRMFVLYMQCWMLLMKPSVLLCSFV